MFMFYLFFIVAVYDLGDFIKNLELKVNNDLLRCYVVKIYKCGEKK